MECLPPCVITKLGSGWKRSWALRTVDIALLWGLSKGDQCRYHRHHRNSSRRSRDNCKPGSVGNDWTPSLWPQHGPSGEGIYSLHRPAHCCGSSETLDNQPARPGLPVFLCHQQPPLRCSQQVTAPLPWGVPALRFLCSFILLPHFKKIFGGSGHDIFCSEPLELSNRFSLGWVSLSNFRVWLLLQAWALVVSLNRGVSPQ